MDNLPSFYCTPHFVSLCIFAHRVPPTQNTLPPVIPLLNLYHFQYSTQSSSLLWSPFESHPPHASRNDHTFYWFPHWAFMKVFVTVPPPPLICWQVYLPFLECRHSGTVSYSIFTPIDLHRVHHILGTQLCGMNEWANKENNHIGYSWRNIFELKYSK